MIVDYLAQFLRITFAIYCLEIGVSLISLVLEKGDIVAVLRDDLPQLVIDPFSRMMSVWLDLLAQLPTLLVDIVKWLGRAIVLGVCALINVVLPLVDLPTEQVKLALPMLFT